MGPCGGVEVTPASPTAYNRIPRRSVPLGQRDLDAADQVGRHVVDESAHRDGHREQQTVDRADHGRDAEDPARADQRAAAGTDRVEKAWPGAETGLQSNSALS